MKNKVITFHELSDISWVDQAVGILKSKFNLLRASELENYLSEGKTLRNTCHITFDDGDISFYEVIYPILEKHNVPATVFVSPFICKERKNFWFQEIEGFDHDKLRILIADKYEIDYKILDGISVFWILKNLRIGEIWHFIDSYKKINNCEEKEPRNINNDQLSEIDRSGLVEIGAHTLNHPVLANEDDKTSESEIIDSFKGLEEILGHKIRYFAYPNGIPGIDFGEREINTLKNIGCKLAFSAEPRSFSIKEKPFSFPRYIFEMSNMLLFRIKLNIGDQLYKSRHLIMKEEGRTRMKLKRKIAAFHQNI